MDRERITVNIADLKMSLFTADADATRRMAVSLDARISKLSNAARCPKNNALVMLILEQAEGQKRSAELIRSQQEQIFSLLQKNAMLSGGEVDEEIYEELESSLMAENAALRRKIDELIDELTELKAGE